MTTIARVTRTSVLASESMIGKRVITLDGSAVKITDVASSYAYSHDGGRSRLSAYLLVKDGRNFKQIEQEDVDGKVTAVEDMDGFAKYTFAGKGKKAAPKADPKPEPKPRPGSKKQPKEEPQAEPKPRPGSKKQPKADPKPAPQAGGKVKPKPAGAKVKRTVEIHELPEPMAKIAAEQVVSPEAVSELRLEVQNYLQERYCVGPFAGVKFASDSTCNTSADKFMLQFALDLSSVLVAGGAEAVDVDTALEQLIRLGIVGARQARTLTDEEILTMYEQNCGEELPEPKPKAKRTAVVAEEFDDFEEEEQEEEEPEEEQEIAHISLPPELFKGYVAPKAHDAARAMTALADAWEVGTGDLFPGVLLQYEKAGEDEPLEVAYIGLAMHKGAVSLMVVDTDTVSDDPEVKARRLVLKLDAACTRCLPLYEEEQAAEEEEADDTEIDELDADDAGFEIDLG